MIERPSAALSGLGAEEEPRTGEREIDE